MRWAAILAFSTILGAVEIAGLNVQSVYLMPMSGGMDQFLAHQLTNAGTFSVVTDPKRADALFTDRLGETLKAELEKLNAPPKAAAEKKKDDDSKSDDTSDSKSDKDAIVKGDPIKPTPRSATNAPPPTSGFGHGKGTLFLVDAKSGRVLWSAYAKAKNTSPDELEKTAAQVVKGLTKTLAAK